MGITLARPARTRRQATFFVTTAVWYCLFSASANITSGSVVHVEPPPAGGNHDSGNTNNKTDVTVVVIHQHDDHQAADSEDLSLKTDDSEALPEVNNLRGGKVSDIAKEVHEEVDIGDEAPIGSSNDLAEPKQTPTGLDLASQEKQLANTSSTRSRIRRGLAPATVDDIAQCNADIACTNDFSCLNSGAGASCFYCYAGSCSNTKIDICGNACSTDNHCQSWNKNQGQESCHYCVSGGCWPFNKPCSSDTECRDDPAKSTCLNGTCQWSNYGQPCFGDASCQGELYDKCVSGACTGGRQSDTIAQAPVQQQPEQVRTYAGTIIPITNYGEQCFGNDNCSTGFYDTCISGKCTGRSGDASTSTPAPVATVVEQQEQEQDTRASNAGAFDMIPRTNYGYQCFGNRSCFGQFYDKCVLGKCTGRTPASVRAKGVNSCARDEDCVNRLSPFCVNANCAASNLGKQCFSNNDCASGDVKLCDPNARRCAAPPTDGGTGTGTDNDNFDRQICVSPSQLQRALDSRSSGGTISLCRIGPNDDRNSVANTIPGGTISSDRSNVVLQCSQGDPTTSSCILSGDRNGPVLQLTGDGVTVRNVQFDSGLAAERDSESRGNGGGLRLTGENARIEDCTFYGNVAELRGGAIYSENPVTVINSVFKGNFAPRCTNVHAAGQCMHMG